METTVVAHRLATWLPFHHARMPARYGRMLAISQQSMEYCISDEMVLIESQMVVCLSLRPTLLRMLNY
jgi:hypothetical protein